MQIREGPSISFIDFLSQSSRRKKIMLCYFWFCASTKANGGILGADDDDVKYCDCLECANVRIVWITH